MQLLYLFISISIITISSYTNTNRHIKLSSSLLLLSSSSHRMKDSDVYDLVVEYLTSKGIYYYYCTTIN